MLHIAEDSQEFKLLNELWHKEISTKDIYLINGSVEKRYDKYQIVINDLKDMIATFQQLCNLYNIKSELLVNREIDRLAISITSGALTDMKMYIIISGYIYYNNTLLCSDVQSFSTKIVQKNGKDVLVVNLKLASSSFSTEYVIG